MNDIQQIKEIRKHISHWNLFVKEHCCKWLIVILASIIILTSCAWTVFSIYQSFDKNKLELSAFAIIVTITTIMLIIKPILNSILIKTYQCNIKYTNRNTENIIYRIRYNKFVDELKKMHLSKKEVKFIMMSFEKEKEVKFNWGAVVIIGTFFITTILEFLRDQFPIESFTILISFTLFIAYIGSYFFFQIFIITIHRKKNILYNFLRDYYYDTYINQK